MQLELTVAASATDAAIQKEIYGSGTIALTISKEEIDDIMKIVESPEECCLLIKGVRETFQNEVKEQKAGFLGMLLGTLGANL